VRVRGCLHTKAGHGEPWPDQEEGDGEEELAAAELEAAPRTRVEVKNCKIPV
jgi:hypothetical protein